MAKGEANYRKGLRNSVYGLWAGVLDASDFQNAMSSTIERWLTVAWNEGAADCGIGPEDLTVEEHRALLNAIDNELGHLSGYADYIIQNSKANGGKRATVFKRLENWVRRYKDLTNRAKTMACKDKKLEWRLGATEDHCSTCNKLHGKVKRASYWEAAGLHPQDPPNGRLDCGGWNCLCELRLTDKPISKGPVPGGRGPVVTPSEPKPTIPSFKPATSISEALTWASEHDLSYVPMGEVSLETVNAFNQAMFDLMASGANIPRIKLISDEHDLGIHNLAQSRNVWVRFNPSAMDTFIENQKEALDKWGHKILTDLSWEGVARHELTHSVVSQLDEKTRQEIITEASSLMEGSKEWLSIYSTGNESEFLAELGSAYLGGQSLPKEPTKLIKKVLGIS